MPALHDGCSYLFHRDMQVRESQRLGRPELAPPNIDWDAPHNQDLLKARERRDAHTKRKYEKSLFSATAKSRNKSTAKLATEKRKAEEDQHKEGFQKELTAAQIICKLIIPFLF
jgi:hypothetical protein